MKQLFISLSPRESRFCIKVESKGERFHLNSELLWLIQQHNKGMNIYIYFFFPFMNLILQIVFNFKEIKTLNKIMEVTFCKLKFSRSFFRKA